jgi:hypothetical protein
MQGCKEQREVEQEMIVNIWIVVMYKRNYY